MSSIQPELRTTLYRIWRKMQTITHRQPLGTLSPPSPSFTHEANNAGAADAPGIQPEEAIR
jgi:hypothetical protein